ncbi:hypothetical protein TPA0906_20760 [Streptomyces olivaceus]|nr:hypothetical protein TPA0906_20760 [Streptomyces olivaceus]
MSITSAEQMSMKPVLAAESSVSAASVMAGAIGVSSSLVRPRAGEAWAGLRGGPVMRHDIGAARFPWTPRVVSPP